MSDELARLDGMENFYTLVPEQGLCLIGDAIVNLKAVSLIRRADGKTLIYCQGVTEPVSLPAEAFDQIREAAFAMDDLDDEDFELDEED